MSSVTVIIPVLGRPRNVAPLVRSLELGTALERADGWKITPLFVCSEGDRKQIAAVEAAGLEPLIFGRPNDRNQYPKKINAGALHAQTEWLFLGADDLEFHPLWLRHAVSAHIETGCLVVGTNDLGNPAVKAGRHATHSLVHSDYVRLGTIDEPGKLLHEGYDHNSCDVEFIETAKFREQFVFASKSEVEHQHPLWNRRVKRDSTYHKGIRYAIADRRYLNKRRHLWHGATDNAPAPIPRNSDELRRLSAARRREVARWPGRR